MSDTKRVIVTETFRASRGVTHAVMKAMEARALASQVEDGCDAFHYARDVFDPTLIRMLAIWRDRACFNTHRSRPHLIAWRAKWPDLGISDGALTTYDVSDEVPVY